MAAAVVEIPAREAKPTSRIVFTEGGKGGVGKSAFATMLVEWYRKQSVAVSLIDMDSENKSRGSLTHFFPEARKTNIHRERGMDGLMFALEEGTHIVVADMGAGAGEVAHEWFDLMYADAQTYGLAFTAIGLVTPDPASVSSVLAWANFLQHRVDYLIVKNSISNPSDFSCWENDPQAEAFRRLARPRIISMQYRVQDIEQVAREHGVTMQAVADKKVDVPGLKEMPNVVRANGYRRNLFAELDGVKDLLLL
jgi:MinD-like ATPase involved in chromosome partitioning or flagellar assembly